MLGKFVPNSKQKQAIEHIHGPLLVLAGAGTGKTTVLVERIASLIENRHAQPEEVLAITFTENAAREMKERVAKRLKRKAAIAASTFHAYCQGILKRRGRDFHVLAPEDVYVFLRQRIERLELQRFIRPADLGEFLRDLRGFFDRCHEELIEPEDFQKYVNGLQPGADLPRNCRSKEVEALGGEEILHRWQEIARAYAHAMRLLEAENLGTFGMQISRAVRLLQADAGLLERERRQARFILIDEFQDCNSSNIVLAELLGGDARNIFAVGDPDQAIYRFRGASSAAFQEFQRRFPQAGGVILDENQRSRSNILQVSFAAIRENPGIPAVGPRMKFERMPLRSGRDARDAEQGRLVFDEPVEVVTGSSVEEEASDAADEIGRRRAEMGLGAGASMAVLYRSHAHREKIMEALAARGIPFIVKGMDVLNTPVARDLLAVARAAAQPADVESLFRICAFPQFAMAGEEMRTRLAQARGESAFTSILQAMESGSRVLAAVEAARSFVAQQAGVAAAFAYFVRQFGFDSGDLAVQALVRFGEEWEAKPFVRKNSLPVFLEYLDFFEEAGGSIPMLTEEQLDMHWKNHPDAVQLMTIHGAKGLEFSQVWLLRAKSASFPSVYREPLFEFPPALRGSVATGESKEIHQQEERRLFYVAITRARDRLAVSSLRGSGQDPTPPGFLRPLLQNQELSPALRKREARPAAGASAARVELSPVGSWMLLAPSFQDEKTTLSANAVEDYSTCPLKFKLRREWPIPGQAAAAVQYGNAIHKVLKDYYAPRPGGPEQDSAGVIAAFQREFAKAAIEDPLQRALYEAQGARHLQALVQSRPRHSVDVAAVEASFRFTMGALQIVGRIDRLDRVQGNAVRIVDYKTGRAKTQKYADDSLQLSIYAMGAAEMGFAPGELALLNLQGNEEVVTLRPPDRLRKARQKIEEAAEGIAARAFDAKPGQHCRWCEFERLCPATEQRVFPPVKATVAG